MNIGVVTTQYASNYGALLQSYALQYYLCTELKQESEVLAYYPDHYKDYWRLYPKINGLKDFIIFTLRCFMPWRVLKQKQKYKLMHEFVANKIPCSKPYYSKDEIEADKCHYDALICGSDQIWNVSRHSELQEVWFLDLHSNGWDKAIKISYAPSIAEPIPNNLKADVAKRLKSFAAVSVRESTDIEQVDSLYDGQVHHVCDPVFLLSQEQWRLISKKPTIGKPFILCYFLNPNKYDKQVVSIVKKLTGLPVVQIDINNINKIPTDVDVLNASPEEFVGWIDNAAYVITNSFHGAAFSILFRKNLLVLKKEKANSRLNSLLNLTGLMNRLVSLEDVKQMKKEDLSIDYTLSETALRKHIEDSKRYLMESLGVEK